jgi:cytochrome c peroxidase
MHRAIAAIALLALLSAGAVIAQPSSEAPPETPPAGEPITPIPQPPAADPLKLALGEALFQDVRLSHDNSRSCASCHDVASNGADADQRAKAADGSDRLLNSISIFNSTLSFRLGWDGRYRSFEEQAAASINDKAVMASSTDEILAKLDADEKLTAAFVKAYAHRPDPSSLIDALSLYERSLVTPDSRFDRWLEGDAAALTGQERNGYRLFKSLGCISCHQGVNIGGNLFERHGIFHPLASPKPEILRVPSLRNVATTPPYFHDGSAPTLTDAVRKMGFAQLDQALTDNEVEDIVAFLGTLTGTYRGSAVRPAKAADAP